MTDQPFLEREFRRVKRQALAFIDQFNDHLPTAHCPACGAEGHVPGLPCPEATCGYVHPVSWVIISDSEWGYDVVSLRNRKDVVASFNVEEVT